MQIWTLLGCGAKQVVQPPSGCNYSIPQQLMTKKKHHFRGAITCHRIAFTCSWLLVYYTLSRNIFRLEELTALSDYVRSHLAKHVQIWTLWRKTCFATSPRLQL